jgi:hypothetical protein
VAGDATGGRPGMEDGGGRRASDATGATKNGGFGQLIGQPVPFNGPYSFPAKTPITPSITNHRSPTHRPRAYCSRTEANNYTDYEISARELNKRVADVLITSD